jgi:hypothetical protein
LTTCQVNMRAHYYLHHNVTPRERDAATGVECRYSSRRPSRTVYYTQPVIRKSMGED